MSTAVPAAAAEGRERALLRERLGEGARYDAPDAPALELAWARRGAAYFARVIAGLDDDELGAPSLLPGWTRAHVIAHVGYNARALSRLVEWARTGVETPMYRSPEQRAAEIERGSTLPPRALRFLVAHAEVHLNVEWRDVPEGRWDSRVVTAQGRLVPARETAWMRAREVWVHAVDLDATGSYLDFPPDLLDRLLADVPAAWARREEDVALVLEPTDRSAPVVVGEGTGEVPHVSGTGADLARWLTGRGERRLVVDGRPVDEGATLPEIPRWF